MFILYLQMIYPINHLLILIQPYHKILMILNLHLLFLKIHLVMLLNHYQNFHHYCMYIFLDWFQIQLIYMLDYNLDTHIYFNLKFYLFHIILMHKL